MYGNAEQNVLHGANISGAVFQIMYAWTSWTMFPDSHVDNFMDANSSSFGE